jgi:flavodoxin
MMRVLVTAATKYGATAEIAQMIGQVLGEHGFNPTVIPPKQVEGWTATTRSSLAARCTPGTG